MTKNFINLSQHKSTALNSLTEKHSTLSGEFNLDYSETANSDIKNLNSKFLKKKGKWSKHEDLILKNLINQYGQKCWKRISERISGRSPIQCLHRWTKILQPGLIKGPWTIDQDRKLIEWVKTQGPNNWSQCSEILKGRSGKQCRERWYNTLSPEVKKGNWSAQEDYLIFDLYSKLGSHWTKIASQLPGRTENSIKNRFYSTLRRIASQTKELCDNSSSSMIPKEKLIEFVPDAFKEKKLNFLQFKGVQSIEIIENPDYFQKDIDIVHNRNSLYEIKVDENTQNLYNLIKNSKIKNEVSSKEDFEYQRFKETPTEMLECNIDNMCEVNPFDDSKNNSENCISEFIQNFFESRKFEKEELPETYNYESFVKSEVVNEIENENFNMNSNLEAHLEELENILKETKSELIKRSRRRFIN